MSEQIVASYIYSTSHTGCLQCNSSGYVLVRLIATRLSNSSQIQFEKETLALVQCKYCNGRGHLWASRLRIRIAKSAVAYLQWQAFYSPEMQRRKYIFAITAARFDTCFMSSSSRKRVNQNKKRGRGNERDWTGRGLAVVAICWTA